MDSSADVGAAWLVEESSLPPGRLRSAAGWTSSAVGWTSGAGAIFELRAAEARAMVTKALRAGGTSAGRCRDGREGRPPHVAARFYVVAEVDPTISATFV